MAELLLWEASLKFKQLKYVKGMIDFRSSWKRFEECAYIRSAIRGTEETGTPGTHSARGVLTGDRDGFGRDQSP